MKFLLLILPLSLASCQTVTLKKEAEKVAVVYQEPKGCELKSEITGRGEKSLDVLGVFTKSSKLMEIAISDLKNKTHELNADTVFIFNKELKNNSAFQFKSKKTRFNQTKGMMEDGTYASTIYLSGKAYKCH